MFLFKILIVFYVSRLIVLLVEILLESRIEHIDALFKD